MAIDSSTTLQTTGPAADLVRAYLLGVESSTGKVKDLVNNVEKAITLNGGMTRGSDSDGDALISATESSDNASIAEDLDPAGTALSVALTFKPSTLTIGDWRGLFAMFNGTGALVHMGKYDGSGDVYWSNQSGNLLQFTALSNLAANTLATIVVTWDGATAKLFMPGVASISHSWSDHAQTSGAATALRIANTSAGDGGFRGRYYFFGYSNTAWSDTDAQAVADDIEGQLFASASSTQTLTPSLFTNTQTFHAATVTPGAVSLTPSLFTNTNSFKTATVSASYDLAPSLFTNSQSFFTPTMSVGAVTLTPSLVTNTQTFYSATVGQGDRLLPSLFTNTQTFYGPTVTVGAVTLQPELFANDNRFFQATITGGVVVASPKPAGAPGHRVKFRGRFYDSIRDRHRLARDVNEFLSEKQEEQPKPAQKPKRKVIKVSGVKIATPPVVLDTREIDELSDVLAQLKTRDAQFTAYIAQLRAINEALMRDEEDFLVMVA